MGWTTPKTWTPGEMATADLMNAQVRDNLNVLKTNITSAGLVGRLLHYYEGTTGNVGTGEDTLTSWTLPADYLVTGRGIRVRGYGTLAANTKTKTVRFKPFASPGTEVTLVSNNTNVASNMFTFDFVWTFSDVSSSVDNRLYGYSTFNSASGAAPTYWHLAANGSTNDYNETVAAAQAITGEAENNNDIVLLNTIVWWLI